MKFLKIEEGFYINTNKIIQITQLLNDVMIEYQTVGDRFQSVFIKDVKIDEIIMKLNYDIIHDDLYNIRHSIDNIILPR
jgi:hypothetical protein